MESEFCYIMRGWESAIILSFCENFTFPYVFLLMKMKVIQNEKTAEIVGLCLGDGSLTKRISGRLRFQMRGHVEEKDFYDNHVRPLFQSQFGFIAIAKYNGKKPYYGVCSERANVCAALTKLGVPIGVKKELSVPSWIKKNRRYMAAFIRGAIDTDGSLFCGKDYNYPKNKHKKVRMSFVNISSTFVKEVSEGLKLFGIHNLIIKPYKSKISHLGTLNKIEINGPNVIDYMRIIGSKNPKHNSKFEVWKRFGFCPPYTTLEQRQKILNNQLDPEEFYARVSEWSNEPG
jgi:hypothetical protein